MDLTLFPLESIRARGEIGERMELTDAKIMRHTDFDRDFLSHFQHRRPEPDAPGGFAGCGMLLDAAVKAVASGAGGETMRDWTRRRIADVLATQSADGAISMFLNAPGIWNDHEQAYLIQALTGAWEHLGDQAALAGAIRLGNWMISAGSGPNIGVESAFLALYRATGDERFLRHVLVKCKLDAGWSEYAPLLAANGPNHVYTWLARLLAQLEHPSPTAERGAEELLRRLFDGHYVSVAGAVSGGFGNGEIWDDNQLGVGKMGETCAAAYLLRILPRLMVRRPEARLGDLFERVMYNTFFAAQSADGLAYRYFVPFDEAGPWYGYDTYCCPNNFKRMMFELPQFFWLKLDDGVLLNLYNASSLRANGLEFDLDSNYPDGSDATLTVKTAGRFKLALRVPCWCRNFTASCGDTTWIGIPGSILTIERVWRHGDQVKITLPAAFRLERGIRAQHGRAALLRGSLVYGVPDCGMDTPCLEIGRTAEIAATAAGAALTTPGFAASSGRFTVNFVRFSDPARSRTFLKIRRR